MSNADDVINDDELLYRRILPEYFDSAVDDKPSPDAFRPQKNDVTGLSLFRAKFRAPEVIVGSKPGRLDFVGVVRVGDLRANGIDVVVNDLNDPGHVEIQSMRYELRRTEEVIKKAFDLAKIHCRQVLGPFPPLPPQEP